MGRRKIVKEDGERVGREKERKREKERDREIERERERSGAKENHQKTIVMVRW